MNDLETRIDAEKYRALHTPEIDDFLIAVEREALFQREKWAASGDAGKTDADWFWLLGYLGGKAIDPRASRAKQLHHIITTAAACLNWHAARIGTYSDMRPGIASAYSGPRPETPDSPLTPENTLLMQGPIVRLRATIDGKEVAAWSRDDHGAIINEQSR